jgi:hypothetical protein
LDPLILNRTLKLIEEIYDESMYGDPDIHRIKDLIHSVDNNHWKNKQWLADIFRNVYDYPGGKFIVLGGWYGMTAYQLRKRFPNESINIISSDLDSKCELFGHKLFYDQHINFTTGNMFDSELAGASAIISTSAEHVDREDLIDMIKRKDKNTWVVLQSNNYHDHPTHINTSNSQKDFVEYLTPHLKTIEFASTMSNPTFDRYMVIGR